MGPGVVSQPQTLEQLFELMAQKITKAQGPMPEIERANLIADAVYEAAFFILEVTPTTGHHQMFLASELLKRLRNFHSPFFVVSREMGSDEQLRQLFDTFLTSTANWRKEMH